MKEKFHPAYHENVPVHCACGETFTTRSTRKEIRVEICSKCHPFFTGKQKLVDSAGRVERFQKRFGKEIKGSTEARTRKAVAPPKVPKVKETQFAKVDDKAGFMRDSRMGGGMGRGGGPRPPRGEKGAKPAPAAPAAAPAGADAGAKPGAQA